MSRDRDRDNGMESQKWGRERIEGEFQPGYQSDPQELLIYTKMILNENQRKQHQIITLRDFPSLKETIDNYEYCNPSRTTKLTTIYTKVVKRVCILLNLFLGLLILPHIVSSCFENNA